MTRNKSKVVFAVHGEGVYVKVRDSGINPLIFVTDGLPMVFFGRERTGYIKVEKAIEWHRREGKPINLQAAEALEHALDLVRAGKVVDAE